MTQPRRIRSVRLAVAALATAGAILIALPSDGARQPPERSNEGPHFPALPRPLLDEAALTFPPRGTEPPNPAAAVGKRDRARRVARRFLPAFLLYQAGKLDDATRRALNETSTRALARTLLRWPPRTTGSQPRSARLGRLAVIGPFAGQLKVVARLTYPGAEGGLLELALRQRGRRLRVTHLYP